MASDLAQAKAFTVIYETVKAGPDAGQAQYHIGFNSHVATESLRKLDALRVCGNCRFKGEPVERSWGVADEMATAAGKPDQELKFMATTFFKCDLIKHDEKYAYLPKAGAVVTDGSGYVAAICVEDDFGCNRWEPRDDLP